MRADPAKIHAVAQISLEVRDTVICGEVEHQPLPLRRGLVRHQQDLRNASPYACTRERWLMTPRAIRVPEYREMKT